MVSQKKFHIQKRSAAHGQPSSARMAKSDPKGKKKVTWDKAIALKEEEILEMENEPQCPPSTITFIGKVNSRMGKVDSKKEIKSRFKFNLENGRVDVLQVLERIGVFQLQYETEPGVWHILDRLESGKSTNTFKSGQVVPFKLVPGSSSTIIDNDGMSPIKCRSIASRPLSPQEGSLRNLELKVLPWVDKWLVDGDNIEEFYGRVSRVIEDRSEQGGGLHGIGVALRLAFHRKHTRLLLTCSHIVVRRPEEEKRGQLYAFGGPVYVIHISRKYDLALLQGPPQRPGSRGFTLAPEDAEKPGREVRMLSFPWYLDTLWGTLPLKVIQPSQIPGYISCVGQVKPLGGRNPITVDALATYMGGLPGCSGGAVTLDSRTLCGVHSGVHPLQRHNPQNTIHTISMASQDGGGGGGSTITSKEHKRMGKRKFESIRNPPLYTSCTGTHGYLAVYVSSAHIRETCLEWYNKPKIKRALKRWS